MTINSSFCSSCAYILPLIHKRITPPTCSRKQPQTKCSRSSSTLITLATVTISIITPSSPTIALSKIKSVEDLTLTSTTTTASKSILNNHENYKTILKIKPHKRQRTTKPHYYISSTNYLSKNSIFSPSLSSSLSPSSLSSPLVPLKKKSKNLNDRTLERPNLSIEAEAELFTRILVAILSGAIIGVERRAASASAGIRTLTLVSLGSAIFSLTALYGLGGDPARMGAAISTGIGFLGSGAINGQISGSRRQLVTAASIWVAAALGVTSASGLFTLSIMGAFITIWILRWRLIFSILVISLKRVYVPPRIVQVYRLLRAKLKQFLSTANLHSQKYRSPHTSGGKDDDR